MRNHTQARLAKLSAMSQDRYKDPMDFMERIRHLSFKVYFTLSLKDGKKLAATRFHCCRSDRVMAKQLLAAGVTDKVQLVVGPRRR